MNDAVFSLNALTKQVGDTKTVYKNGKPKKARITINEKKDQLRTILYEQAKDQKKHRKSMKNDEIIDILKIEQLLTEKYPLTNPIERDLITNGLAGKIRNIKG